MKIFLFLMFFLLQNIFADVVYFDRVIDPITLKKSQYDLNLGINYYSSKIPNPSNENDDWWGLQESEQKLATTIDMYAHLNYGVMDNLTFSLILPFRYFQQKLWLDGDHYDFQSTMNWSNIAIGGKYLVKSSENLNVSLLGNLYVGMLGGKVTATGSVDLEGGLLANYKNLVGSFRLKIPTGKYWWDGEDIAKNQYMFNSNYEDLGKDDIKRIGTKSLYDESNHDDGLKRVMTSYIDLAYDKPISDKLALYVEYNGEVVQFRHEIKVGANIAPNDSRAILGNIYIGKGLTEYSRQTVFGLRLVVKDGLLNPANIDKRTKGFNYYIPSESVSSVKNSSVNSENSVNNTQPVEQKITIYRIAVTSKFANIRTFPSGKAPLLTRAKQGEMFDLIDEKGKWYHIALPNGKEAYLYKTLGMKLKYTKIVKQQAELQAKKDVKQMNNQVAQEEKSSTQDVSQQQKTLSKQEQLKQQQLIEQQRQEKMRQQELQRQQQLQKAKQDSIRRAQELLRKAQEKEQKRLAKIKKYRDVKEQEWTVRKIEKTRHAKKAYKDAVEYGVHNAIIALVDGLGSDRDDTRKASFDYLVQLADSALPFVGKALKTKPYFIKRQLVLILQNIGGDKAVDYLERAFSDKSIEEDIENALKSIPGDKAHKALMNHMQQKLMQAKIDSIKQVEIAKEKALLGSLGLKYGQTKENLLTVAWKIAQYKKVAPSTPQQEGEFEQLKKAFKLLVKKYDKALGANSSKGLLKDNGYDPKQFDGLY